MIRIGICEDEDRQARIIEHMTERAVFERTEYKIVRYSSGEQVVQDIENGSFGLDLLLLDINMRKLSGLDTADYIRRHAMDVDIIFVTVSGKYVYQGYQYKAFSYLLKGEMEQTLKEALNRYLDEWEQVDACLEVPVKGMLLKLPISKIFYLESNTRKITVHMSGEDVEFYGKLDEMEEMLSEVGFFRCHRSYLFNGKYLERIRRESVVINKVEIPMSRKYYEKFKEEGRFFTEAQKKSLTEGRE